MWTALCALLMLAGSLARAASPEFPLPASAAVCPSFARYIRLHRAALGTLGTGPLPLGSFPDGRRFARRGHHHHQQQHGSSSSTHLLHPRRRRVLAGLAAGAGMPQPRARARWLVTADPDGLADRLVNAVSSFYFALLTDRVLCIQPAHAGQPGLEAAFSAPSIDWTCRGAPAPLPGPVAAWNPTEDDAWMDPHFEVYTTFVRSHLNTVGPHNATTIELRMHRGISVALFQNQHHRAQMERMGLRPDTAFGCAVQFLFGLGAETRALAEADPGLHGVMVDEGAIKIGIQVRLGDAHILAQLEKNGETELDEKSRGIISGFLQCAEQLAASVALHSGPHSPDGGGDTAALPAGPPLRLHFYLMTDTLAVRTVARERFGSRLLALNQTAVQFYQNVTAAGLRATALEHWYFSRCHQHVITGHSGMGRTAAFAGLRPGPGLFSMEVADGTRMAGRGCEVGDADRPFDVYNTWSGV